MDIASPSRTGGSAKELFLVDWRGARAREEEAELDRKLRTCSFLLCFASEVEDLAAKSHLFQENVEPLLYFTDPLLTVLPLSV